MQENKNNSQLSTVTLDIQGMTCDHCAVSIEKKFEGKKGIAGKKVSYGKSKGEFTFDPSIISKQNIIDTINSTKSYRVVGNGNENGTGKKHFDLIIIGGGSAAFSAAIKAEELGLSTLMVNAGLPFGGTCVNVGCVPSKTLIRSAETVYHATHSNFDGIKPKGADVDFTKVIKDKKNLVATLQQKKYLDVVSDFENLKMIDGWAEFLDTKTILVNGNDKYTALKFIIATGSTTNVPEIEGLKNIGYLTNATLFDLEEKPESITIMGAGYIGLEIAMAYNRLGVKVRIIEFTDRVLRTQTPDISEELERQMRSEGIEILPNFRAVKFEKSGNDTIIHCKCPDGSMTKLTEPGRIVVVSGITANTKRLGSKNIGLKLTEKGSIVVNEKMETNVPNIYAAGDVTNTPSFVYTAAHEGKVAVENAFMGAEKKVDYTSLPWVVFTDPQIAGAGLDEVQAEVQGIPFEVSKLPLSEVPRSIAARDTRGFIKLIRNTETDKLIGARVVAPEGGELIQQLSMAIKYGITVKELAQGLYPYLTLGEGIKLAAITFGKDVSKLSCCAS
ncbi:MAG: Mercuric ion reductase [Cytophagales bacterium]|jgi:mercuric reductase|nr:mercury(II) reductase [Bacteroidota bacterium]MBS1950718.1 mercury(II) reductase [Bacteroidota bacterium]MBS1980722.1 mercury(II) reductase [Bacteroidota bacterium]WHZ08059.1 MAG: Mercuric ion reductase [Cytophagales bacterium]